MKIYKFEPKPCYNDNGITYRPFHLDEEEIYRMNISVMLGSDKEAADKQMIELCEVIKEKTGAIVSPGELPDLIKVRKIIVE